jgi:hypothetical protein
MSPGGAAHEATPSGNSDVEAAKACPSGRCEEGALLLGVMTPQGTLAYVQPPTHVNADFVERAKAMGRPESRFRFSVSCIEGGCPQWTGKGCAVIDKVLEEEKPVAPPESGGLPRCAIRRTCRWFAQRGPAACGVCPLVVADIGGIETYRSTVAAAAEAGP